MQAVEKSSLKRDQYTRISSILYPFSGLQNIPPDIVENAADRGTKVHKICEGIISGLGEFCVDDETYPYVESFKLWWGPGVKTVGIEKRFWCDDLLITGQIDMLVEAPTGLYIIDLKTSSKPSKTWQAQGEGYYYLARKNGLDVKGIIFLHLQKTGKCAKEFEYEPKCDFFLKVHDVYKHFFHKEAK